MTDMVVTVQGEGPKADLARELCDLLAKYDHLAEPTKDSILADVLIARLHRYVEPMRAVSAILKRAAQAQVQVIDTSEGGHA